MEGAIDPAREMGVETRTWEGGVWAREGGRGVSKAEVRFLRMGGAVGTAVGVEVDGDALAVAVEGGAGPFEEGTTGGGGDGLATAAAAFDRAAAADLLARNPPCCFGASASSSRPSSVARAPPTAFLPIDVMGMTGAPLCPPSVPLALVSRLNVGKMGFSSPINAAIVSPRPPSPNPEPSDPAENGGEPNGVWCSAASAGVYT